MAEVPGVVAAEVQCLRQEITMRITLMHALIALELAALGTGLTLGRALAYVLAGLAAISSFLWLLWMDQSLSTYKIAAYLAVEVAPRLTRQAGYPVLQWETFLRRIEAPGASSGHALFPGSGGQRPRLVRSGLRADLYVPVLFGGTPPLLLTFYALTARSGTGAIWAGCVIAGLMWAYAVSRFTDFMHNVRVLNGAIMEASAAISSTDPGPAPRTPARLVRPRWRQVRLVNGLPRRKLIFGPRKADP